MQHIPPDAPGRLPMHAQDPPPVPPDKPLPSDCCDSGCDRCVFDQYAEELSDYETARQEWLERQTPPP